MIRLSIPKANQLRSVKVPVKGTTWARCGRSDICFLDLWYLRVSSACYSNCVSQALPQSLSFTHSVSNFPNFIYNKQHTCHHAKLYSEDFCERACVRLQLFPISHGKSLFIFSVLESLNGWIICLHVSTFTEPF